MQWSIAGEYVICYVEAARLFEAVMWNSQGARGAISTNLSLSHSLSWSCIPVLLIHCSMVYIFLRKLHSHPFNLTLKLSWVWLTTGWASVATYSVENIATVVFNVWWNVSQMELFCSYTFTTMMILKILEVEAEDSIVSNASKVETYISHGSTKTKLIIQFCACVKMLLINFYYFSAFFYYALKLQQLFDLCIVI